MSQRAILRGFFLCILAVLAAMPGWAQTMTISPSTVNFGIGETSPLITAQIEFPVGAPVPTGTETLYFSLPWGVSTFPSTITYTVPAGQYSATVTFRLVASQEAWPGGFEASIYSSPSQVSGSYYIDINGLTVTPSTVNVTAGDESRDLSALVGILTEGDPGPQELVFTGLPRGASPVPSPVSFVFPTGQQGYGYQRYAIVGFRIAADAGTNPGTYEVGVQTTPSTTGSDTFRLTVVAPVVPGDLGIAVEKPSVNACPGGPAVANSVTITPLDGYSGSPTVTFPSLPSELSISPTSIPVGSLPPARSVSFEVTALPGALPGQKVVNVLVKDPGGPAGFTSFVVNVGAADFSPVISPATIELTSGGDPVPVTVSLAPGACSPPSSITVTPTGLPAGVTVTPASADLLAPSYSPVVFTFSAASSVPAGTVEATFTFTPSTGEPKSTTTPVSVVRNGQIGVSVERAAMDVCPGGAGGTNSLTITPLDGYSGTPTVTFPTLPDGLTVTPSTIPVPAMPPVRIVFFDVAAAPGTPSGPATLTALVSDPRGITSTATFIANVLPPAFTPAAAPSAVTLNGGGSAGTITASLVAGDCIPTSDITVTPSGLPPGVTVTPASAAIVPPALGPVTFSFEASSSAAPGPSTIVFTFRTGEGLDRTTTAVITVCGPPEAPVSPVVSPQGNPQGPVTATDFLALKWGAPASGSTPTRYEWRINGGTWSSVAGTSASAPPRGAIDPVQLFVRGYACDPERGPGAEAASPVYSLAAPVASFAVPASIVAGRAVTFTDTSSPQATSWLWFPGDGMPATTVQSPTVTFPAAGPKVIVLVASNGSGSSSKATTVNVLPASAVRAAAGFAVRSLERQPDGRLALGRVEVEPGATLLLRRLEGEGEAVAFLRFVEPDGRVVLERRLVLAAGEEARHDLSAWGASGAFRVELVGPDGLEAAVEEMSIPFGAPELPVTPRRPRSTVIR